MKGLIDSSEQSGAQGIKFQVMTKTSDFVSTKHTAYSALDSYCLNLNDWKELFSYTQKKGLDIIMMPLNIEAFELLKQFKVKYLDIHSVSFYDDTLLEAVKLSKQDIILGVGGRTLDEIEDKRKYFEDSLKILMVGFQAFPSKIEDVKIGKISHLINQFPDLQIGYADHSSYDDEFAIKSNEYARILGATVFEKHITTHEGVDRVDFSAAISSIKINEIINKLNFIDEFIITDHQTSFEFTEREIIYRDRQLRCVAKTNLKAGTLLSKEMICLKLIDDQEDAFNNIHNLSGKILMVDLEFDSVLKTQNVN